jgi:Tfp pilus assembly protein PilV
VREACRGLTVIETLIAATLFLTAIVVVVGLFPASARAARQAQGHLLATNLAERELELARAASYGALEDRQNSYTLQIVNNGAKTDMELTTRVKISEVRDGLKRILVVVDWQGTDLFNKELQMETYAARLTP